MRDDLWKRRFCLPNREEESFPERLLLEQTTLECANDLGTRIPESEARSDRVSRIEDVAVTSRFAVLWMIRAKWNCLGDICELTRADSASDEVILSGYWFKRWNGKKAIGMVEAAGMLETTGSTSTFVTNAGVGGAVAEMMPVWRAAMSRYSAWSWQTRPSAERKEYASGRLAYAQCAQVGETEHVSQQGYSTSTGHGPKRV